jgi:glycosyltransferase involved in cell wall biosynthesis
VRHEGIKVSVCTTTYNHERFIAQTVESVMAQDTDFQYEHVIGEDCSTDRTRDILLDYQQRYPDRLVLLLREQNIGRRSNFVDALRTCQGEYIAILEGDDYWTSPQKLQRQADYLDDHPECVICFHPVIKYYEDENREVPFVPSPLKGTYVLDDLLERNFIATCSVMFRNGLIDEYPPWFQTVPAADLPLHVLHAQHGDIGYLDEMMAVHRIHAGGVWSPKHAVDRLQAKIEVLEALKQHLGPPYEKKLDDVIARAHVRMIRALSMKRGWAAIPGHLWDLVARNRVGMGAIVRAIPWGLGRRVGGDE